MQSLLEVLILLTGDLLLRLSTSHARGTSSDLLSSVSGIQSFLEVLILLTGDLLLCLLISDARGTSPDLLSSVSGIQSFLEVLILLTGDLLLCLLISDARDTSPDLLSFKSVCMIYRRIRRNIVDFLTSSISEMKYTKRSYKSLLIHVKEQLPNQLIAEVRG